MQVDFHCLSPAQEAGAAPALPLRTVYHLHADRSYRVTHQALNGNYVLLLTLAGEGRLDLGGELSALGEGSCMLLSPQREFRYWCERETWEFWWFEFEGRQFQPRLEPGCVYGFARRAVPEELCGECLRLLRQGEADAASAVFGALYCLTECEIAEQAEQPAGSGLCHSVTRYIHAHLPTVTAGELSARFFVSERTLRNLFWRHLGMPPREYIQQKRLDAACYLLRSTTMPVSEIAESLGYSSPFHLSNVFKARKGVSPRAYRRGRED